MKTLNFTAKDKINARTGKSLQTIAGQTINVRGMSTYERLNNDGNNIMVGALVTTDGETYTTISANAIGTIEDIIDLMVDENLTEITIEVTTRKSNSGRDYLVLNIAG